MKLNKRRFGIIGEKIAQSFLLNNDLNFCFNFDLLLSLLSGDGSDKLWPIVSEWLSFRLYKISRINSGQSSIITKVLLCKIN